MTKFISLSKLTRFWTKAKNYVDTLISNHTHNYLPTSGGTVNGNVDVVGVLRVRGQQAFNYNASTNSQTLGTNNATGGTTVCCGSSADLIFNGANAKMPNAIPKASNTYTLGSTSARWKAIYSNSAINIASDRRLKHRFYDIDRNRMRSFIDGLDVYAYNYRTDNDDAPSRIGLVAQEVIDVDPGVAEFFVEKGADGYYGLKTADLVYALIATVQELSREIETLKGLSSDD